MVVKSVLPNLLNVAQIVNIFNNASMANVPGSFYAYDFQPRIGEPSNRVPSSIASTYHTRDSDENEPNDSMKLHWDASIENKAPTNTVENSTTDTVMWRDECTLETIAVHSQRVIKLIFNDLYDKHLTPDPNGVTVSIELALQTFYDISENSASFTADVLMSQIWHDKRLSYARFTNCVENLTLSSAITDKIWQPFVCFVNSKKSELHTSPSPNTFVLIYPNGTVWVNYRLRIEGPCYVNLELYPFNEEECELILESYAYNAANVRLKWRDWNPVLQYPSRTKLPDFVLSEIKWAKHQFIYAAGQWDQLTVNFFLTRQFGVYIVQMYVPVETAVAMSWIPFFLDHRSLPARITLGVSAMMSITFQYGNILKNLPRVSYIMSVDVWIFVAVMFVACSLVELAIVGHLHRKARQRSERRADSCRYTTRKRKSTRCRKFSEMTVDSMASFRANDDASASQYGTFFQDWSDAPNGASILQMEPRDDATTRQNVALASQNTANGGRVSFGALSRFSKTSLTSAAEWRRRRRDYSQYSGGSSIRASANFNYAVFRAQFAYKKIRDKWKDPLYWDERARVYFPLSFFIFNLFYWFYYLGYQKFLKPILQNAIGDAENVILSESAASAR